MIKRNQYQTVIDRLNEPRKFIQVLAGPRQVGKSTLIGQVLEDIKISHENYSADLIPAASTSWISDIWETVRNTMILKNLDEFIIVIDEIQKITNWSEAIKKEWDEDSRNNINIKVLLSGSSRLLLKKGLTESLAGRFELIRMPHWSFSEMQQAFGFSLEQYVYFGAYPGAASIISDESRWKSYIKDSIIEATLSKDVLMTTSIYKPALLRQLFELGCSYSGQLISLNKLIGQLQDAGNVTTLSNYLQILDQANLLTGLQKFAGDKARKYNSIPKLQVYNNALRNAYEINSFESCLSDTKIWGHLIESAIGAYLINQSDIIDYKLFYWRENDNEVDFIIERSRQVIGIEVKSGKRTTNNGLSIFRDKFKPKTTFVVGSGGISVEDFLKSDLSFLFK